MQKHIYGAGLAGLITAFGIPDAHVYEKGKRQANHQALLRFRSDAVARLTGVPFRPVTVRKGIVSRWVERTPTMALANQYSRKVTGRLAGDRSIWNLDTVTRYVAPENLYDVLVDKLEAQKRITFEATLRRIERGDAADRGIQMISTIPLPAMLAACGLSLPLEGPIIDMRPSEITVRRFRLPEGTDLYQTLYFPDADVRTYRASITGDLLIVEQMGADKDAPDLEFQYEDEIPDDEITKVASMFGLNYFSSDLIEVEAVNQKYGKIVNIPDEVRHSILYELTRDFNVFSIGRFATWRNILLDDVVKDIEVVKSLMASSEYGRALISRS